jgi:hypothetical protein
MWHARCTKTVQRLAAPAPPVTKTDHVISIDYEFTAGDTSCLVCVTTGARPTAWMYVVAGGGHALRALVDGAGMRLEMMGATAHEALRSALHYLAARFGPLGPARHWERPRPVDQGRTILRESPVRPDDATVGAGLATAEESAPETRRVDIVISAHNVYCHGWRVAGDGATAPDWNSELFATDDRDEALDMAMMMARGPDACVFMVDSLGTWTLVRRPDAEPNCGWLHPCGPPGSIDW